MLTLSAIAQALGGEVAGRQVRAPGPGHSPTDRSLSVGINNAGDDIVVKSFADDDPIVCKDWARAKIGLPAWAPRKGRANGNGRSDDDEIDAALAGPAPAPPPSKAINFTSRKPIAEYNYTDATGGTLLYQVQRFVPKDFRQQRPDGNGGWITSRVFEGVTRVPYRWADLAKYPSATVFIVEGERDADSVAELGLCASTVAGGVWTPEIVAVFHGRDIIVLEDNDSVGREKSAKAAAALAPVAKSVRISGFPELPEKADVSDWIALDPERNNADALVARVLQAPLWQPQADATSAAVDLELGEWDAGDDVGDIPPRAWLLGNVFCRRFISSVIAEGGTGKSATRLAQFISLAVDRALTGEHVFERCRVLIVSLEDNADELLRRVRAACLHHGIDQAELRGWLFLASPGVAGGKIMGLDQTGRPVVGALAGKIERTIEKRKIDIVSLDPFVKSHAIEENSNSLIDDVIGILAGLADRFNVAVDVPHHAAKGPSDPGNANRGRGASAMKDAARLVYTLSPMSQEEGQALGLTEIERRRLIRMDSGKVNIAPAMGEAKWFRLVGVDIGNANELYPHGDQVQTVEPWTPPDSFAGLSSVTLNLILSDIEAGTPDGNRYTEAPNANERAAWRVVVKHCPNKTEAEARQIVKVWLKSGLLIRQAYTNSVTRKSVMGLWIDAEKRPS